MAARSIEYLIRSRLRGTVGLGNRMSTDLARRRAKLTRGCEDLRCSSSNGAGASSRRGRFRELGGTENRRPPSIGVDASESVKEPSLGGAPLARMVQPVGSGNRICLSLRYFYRVVRARDNEH